LEKIAGDRVYGPTLPRSEKDPLPNVLLALMEQAICAEAEIFIGTATSMYTQVIEEERDMVRGLSSSTRFTFPVKDFTPPSPPPPSASSKDDL